METFGKLVGCSEQNGIKNSEIFCLIKAELLNLLLLLCVVIFVFTDPYLFTVPEVKLAIEKCLKAVSISRYVVMKSHTPHAAKLSPLFKVSI